MSTLIALVTGGSRGIGLEIVRGLASKGITTVFTSRSKSKGDELADLLSSSTGGNLPVFHHELEVTSRESIAALANWVKDRFGGLDVLVNNAGLFSAQIPELLSLDRAKKIVQTNFYGPRDLITEFIPLLRDGARIINISSAGGRLDFLNGEAKERWTEKLLDTQNLTMEVVEAFVEDFFDAVEKRELEQRGWPWIALPIPGYPPDDVSDYGVSKIALNALTRLVARDHPGFYVNAMCPGFNETEMTYGKHGHPAKEGADTAVWLAQLPTSESCSGKFFVNRKQESFVRTPLWFGDRMGFSHEEFGAIIWGLSVDRGLMLQKLNLVPCS